MALASDHGVRITRSQKEEKSLSMSELSSLQPHSWPKCVTTTKMKGGVGNRERFQTKNQRSRCTEQRVKKEDAKGRRNKKNSNTGLGEHNGKKKCLAFSNPKSEDHNDMGESKKHARTFLTEGEKEEENDKMNRSDEKHQKKIRKGRVSANSRVNFMFLNEEEQVERYRNMLLEYKTLKKGLAEQADCYYNQVSELKKKQQLAQLKHGDHSLKRARVVLKKSEYEIEDCAKLLENLATLLAKKKMNGESLEFHLICALISKLKQGTAQPHSYAKKIATLLKDTDKTEYIQFLTGMSALPHRRTEQYETQYQPFQRAQIMVLHPQSAFTFHQKVNFNNPQMSQQEVIHLPPPPTVNLQPIWNDQRNTPANAYVGLNASMLRRFNHENPSPHNLSEAVNFRAP